MPVTSLPSASTRPALGRSSPAISRISVVLPASVGPSSTLGMPLSSGRSQRDGSAAPTCAATHAAPALSSATLIPPPAAPGHGRPSCSRRAPPGPSASRRRPSLLRRHRMSSALRAHSSSHLASRTSRLGQRSAESWPRSAMPRTIAQHRGGTRAVCAHQPPRQPAPRGRGSARAARGQGRRAVPREIPAGQRRAGGPGACP